jgi:hypothetical protein
MSIRGRLRDCVGLPDPATLAYDQLAESDSDPDNRMKFAGAGRILAVALVAYAVCDILLTPPAGLETRDPAKVTGLGDAVLGLLFVGLALAIVALVLLFRSSRRAPIVAIVAAVLYLPAFLSEQASRFSALRPPVAIQRVELVQAAVAVIVIGLGAWLFRGTQGQLSG